MDESNDPRYNFYASPTVDELIAQQGKGLIGDPKTLLGGFWPEDEPSRSSWKPAKNFTWV